MKNEHLNEKVIGELKEKLILKKDRLEEELKSFAKKNPDAEGDWDAKYNNIGDDWDENAQEVTEYDKNISMEHNLETQLNNVVSALKRIENNTYGFCNVDEKEIPLERLMVNPEATTCIDHSNNNAS